MSEQYKLFHPVQHFRNFIAKDVRLDGRGFNNRRPIALNMGSFKHALGSGAVKIGDTSVTCGIRGALAKPRGANPTRGYICPNIDFSFISSTTKSKYNITNNCLPEALTCMLRDVLVETNCINLEDLCIHPQRLVWVLYLDVVCISMDGGIFDAIVLSAVAALGNLNLPIIRYDEFTGKTETLKETRSIKINATPVVSAFAKFDDVLLVDPTSEEEIISNAMIHVGICKGSLTSIIKVGGEPLNIDDMDNIITSAKAREEGINRLVAALESGKINEEGADESVSDEESASEFCGQ